MKSKRSIIESILKAQNPGISLTPREIYYEMDSSEKGVFSGGVETVRKFLDGMKKKELVENGISEIVNGRSALTWKMVDAKNPKITITDDDIESAVAVDVPANMGTVSSQDNQEPVTHAPILQESEITSTVEAVLPAQAEDSFNQPQVQAPVVQSQAEEAILEPICDTETPEGDNAKLGYAEPQAVEGLEFHDMIDSFGAGVNAFIAGTRKLIAELDKAKAEIERLKASQAIANKRETIAVLKHVQGFVKPINEDFDVVLGDIVQKIEAMPEAA